MAGKDVRSRMVSAGEDLLAERGYGVTMLDVIERADAPRGSIYYHFPDGKNELAVEVARKVTREVEMFVAMTAEKIEDPVAFLQRLLDHHRKRLTTSDYDLGCPMMGIVVTGDGSAELDEAVSTAFRVWTSVIAKALRGKGFTKAQAEQLASLLVTGIEGCIVVSRGRRSTQPFAEFSRTLPLLVQAVSSA
ncbi:MAG TPA: TetR/AcrR family transcriptional regulator [Acidimicrobiales bacterium]|nr:TetR/AcrR family transcriptional regulator [Acidimicrobiales bacterium]